MSTCETEYIATTVAIKEAKFLTQLLNEIHVEKVVEPVTPFVDNCNQSTIAVLVVKDPVRNQRTKHIDIKYHFVRSEIKNGGIAMNYITSEENVADVFTKPVTKRKCANDMKIFVILSESPSKIRNIAVYRFLISFLVPKL